MDVKLVLIVLVPCVAFLALFIGYMGHKLAITRTLGDTETRARRTLDDGQRAVDRMRVEAEGKPREGETRSRAGDPAAKASARKARSEPEQETRARQNARQSA